MTYLWIAVFLIAAVYVLFIFPTQWLLVERVRHPLGLNRKFLQISDLHVDMLRISPEKLVSLIHSEHPDYILLTGDFTRRPHCIPKLERYMRCLASTGVPIFAVLGNHDYKNRSLMRMLDVLKRQGITVLRNESADAGPFQIVGIDDYCSKHANVGKAFQHVVHTKPVLVMTHDPNVVTRISQPFDYLVAGHLHGKQFNVPFFFLLKAKGELPSQGIFRGLHKTACGPFYISKGIGQAGINARFMVRSEVTVHEL